MAMAIAANRGATTMSPIAEATKSMMPLTIRLSAWGTMEVRVMANMPNYGCSWMRSRKGRYVSRARWRSGMTVTIIPISSAATM